VFDDATVYTALQYFSKGAVAHVRIASAPEGEADAADVDWSDDTLAVVYDAIPQQGEWLMATGEDRVLIDRLSMTCRRLDDPAITDAIFQGLVTSADPIYHLERIRAGVYRCSPKKAPSYEVEIEDAIMKPLVSGKEAKRYEEPQTNTFLLFPYAKNAKDQMILLPNESLARDFPKAWQYLKSWEPQLRGREKGKMNRDEDWWAYVYPKSLGRHSVEKLIVPRLVQHLKSALDKDGTYYLDNADVGGVSMAPGTDGSYLNGVLNGRVADFVFRAIAKPFRGDYRSANKQFIAPLPIPDAPPEQRAEVARRARDLQTRWTRRRDLLAGCEARLSVLARARHNERWLWPDLQPVAEIQAGAPAGLKMAGERRDWARARFDEAVAVRCEALQAGLDGGGRLEVAFHDGELKLFAGGQVLLDRIYLDEAKGRLAEAWWRWLLLSQTWREADKLAAQLRRPPADAALPAAAQFIDKVAELAGETAAIEQGETEMNALLFDLYALTPAERLLVNNDRSARGRA